jgi:hypothetical protein
MKVTEAHIQAVMMDYAMGQLNHQMVVPNSNQFFHWEADLLTVTKSRLVHEFEIKISLADYRRDAKKSKHYWVGQPGGVGPSYFWYVTFGFDIEPPDKAGWIRVDRVIDRGGVHYKFTVTTKRDAPRLNLLKLDGEHQWQISRLLSWRLNNIYVKKYLNEKVERVEMKKDGEE